MTHESLAPHDHPLPPAPFSSSSARAERSARALRLVEAMRSGMSSGQVDLPLRVGPLLITFLHASVLSGAFAQLDDRWARLVLAYYLTSTTYAELAREEGISQQAVADLIVRATKRLRRLLPLNDEKKDCRFPSGALRKGSGSNTLPAPRPPARSPRDAAAARWADAAYHQRTAAAIRAASQTEAFRAKIRASWADPATRARRIAAIQAGCRSEAARAKRRSADQRRRQAQQPQTSTFAPADEPASLASIDGITLP